MKKTTYATSPDTVEAVVSDAKRYNEGKAPLSYLLTFPKAIETLSNVLQYGAEKYDRGNYILGTGCTQYVDCLLRHLTAWYNGEDDDPESKQNHLGHVIFNALQLAEVAITMPYNDDRINAKTVQSTGHVQPTEVESGNGNERSTDFNTNIWADPASRWVPSFAQGYENQWRALRSDAKKTQT